MAEGWKPRTVLMTADAVGGVWTYALGLADALAKRNVRVVLATMGEPPRREQRAATSRVPGLEVFESRFALEWMDDPWDDVARAGAWLLELERRTAPDVVHLNGYVHAKLPWRAPCLVVAHSCVLSWWRAVFGEEAPARYARYRQAVASGLANADLVVAPSEAMARALAREHGTTAPVRVVPNGRDPARFGPREKQPFVLAAGRAWDRAKNMETLDVAAREVPWPVFVAGSTQAPDGAVSEPRFARPLGWLDAPALADWMGRAAIYAAPARYEPFGLSILEAGLSGCALVLGDIPSLREIWGEDALYALPDQPSALGEVLAWLARRPRERERLASGARVRALAHSPERMADGYLAAYREASRRRASRRSPSERSAPCA
jgi:glycosyltransferase involved in cell wall biosynthesis